MKILTVLTLLASAATLISNTASASSEFIPYRFQTGSMYKDAVKKEAVLRSTGKFVNTTANFFEQYVDHKDLSRGTFKQRFYVDYTYWDGKAPAALYISGEQVANGSPSGFLQDYAQSINGLLFTLEHRWYGESKLSNNYTDMSLLETLTVDNALADLNYFMTYVEDDFLKQSLKWYSVGGSYAGGLSAWLKQAYPDRLEAAWSSSGVINPQFDYWQYEGHVVDVLPPLCTYSLQQGVNQITAKWNDPIAFAAIQAQFGVANMTQADFGYMLGDAYSGPVQYGQKVAMCDFMVPLQADAIAQFAAMNFKFNGPSFGARWMASRDPTKHGLLSAAPADPAAMSGYLWNFQCCSQMAFWQIAFPAIGTTGTCIRPQAVTTDAFMDVCARDYGVKFFPDVYAFNKARGGAFPNATRVIATQGSDDPFAPAGANAQVNAEYPYVLAQCDGCGHCFDLHASSPTDSASLISQRQTVTQYMNKWLGFTFPVTFNVVAGTTQAQLQASLLSALPAGQTWLSAFVFDCNTNQCYSSFTFEATAQAAITLANNNNIAGVTSAEVTPSTLATDATSSTVSTDATTTTTTDAVTTTADPSNTNTTAPSKKDDDDGSGLSRGVLIGIVIGAVMAFFVILAIIALVIRHRQKQEAQNGYHNVNSENLH